MKTTSMAMWLLPVGVVLAAPVPAPVAMPEPPNVPDSTSAYTMLSALTVAASGSLTGYSRDEFPHWINQGNSCDTREVVLKRDGQGVVTNSACTPTSGTWVSPYDDATWTASSDVDIDHMVPLANAWVSGASSWTTAQRQAFANDLQNPQLWTVTDNVNESKGDRSPDQWKPPLSSFYCTYAEAWVDVKYHYSLTVTEAEYSALEDMLGSC